MIGMVFHRNFRPQWLIKRMKRASRKGLRGAGALVRRIARRDIRKRKKRTRASAPGKPPFTHPARHNLGWNYTLREAIVFKVEGDNVVIGPRASVVSKIGQLHEFGGSGVDTLVIKRRTSTRRGKRLSVRRRYPARPFMRPAMDKAKEGMPKAFKDVLR